MWSEAFGDLELLALMTYTIWVVITTASLLWSVDRLGGFEVSILGIGASAGIGLLGFVSWVDMSPSGLVQNVAIGWPLLLAFYLIYGWLQQDVDGNVLAPYTLAVALWSGGFLGALGAGLVFGFTTNLLGWIPMIVGLAALGAFTRKSLS